MRRKIFFRADGNTEIGMGHVIRSLALADMLKEDFECLFVTRFLTPFIEKEARQSCSEIIKLPESDAHFNEFLSLLKGDEIVVLDNYFFTTEYQKAIKEIGCKLVCIDDIHDKHFVADVVINHAGGFNRQLYSTSPHTALYTGTEYALLRAAFLSRKEKQGTDLMISMGGADANNNILKILKIVENKEEIQSCYVVIGDAYKYEKELDEYCKKTQLNLHILKNLDMEEMANLMLKCSCAILPPSTISYEYLSLAGGELYIHKTADNQKDLYHFFCASKLAFDLSELFIKDKNLIQESIDNQKKIFDGKSKERLRSVFSKLEKEQTLTLRKANINDLDLYFEWANDPEERKNAVNTEIISYKNHCSWFSKKIEANDAYLWILEQENAPIGQIRFDIENGVATLSYFIDERYREQGFGLAIVKLGIENLTKKNDNIVIRAVAKKINIASCKIFECLNFQRKEINHVFFEYVK